MRASRQRKGTQKTSKEMRGEDEKEEAWVEALSCPLTGNGGSRGQGLELLHEAVPP